ncbi:MAG: hypothetical protein P4L61_02750 [Candidatus Pacebacteria bacterium]|nr:hypothetical protein [Candidatus Paceibacterota bacterium]
MNTKKIVSSIAIGAGAVIIGLGLQYALADWTSAPSNPPSGNTPAPLNVGSEPQIKSGILGVIGLVTGTLNVAAGASTTAGTVLTNDGAGNASWASGGSGSIPSGAIMAFALSACPTGWSAYSAAVGRAVIGSGSATASTSAQALGSIGGKESYNLTVSQLPKFTVTTNISENFEDGNNGSSGGGHSAIDPGNTSFVSNSVGGGQAYSAMQPYIAELYCVKN